MLQMHRRVRGLSALLCAVLLTVAIGACGSSGSSQSANGLLKQTFSGSHTVNSGVLGFSVTLDPSGSTKLTTPVTLSFGGPFQSLGKGKLPKSNFNVSISALGHTGALGILSTGTAGYVSLQGTSYQMPTATFEKLESNFASLASSPSSSGSGLLGKLGIDPLDWLENPKVMGTETVGGVATTHIHAGINVTKLLSDLSTYLGTASSLGISSKIPTSISPATQSKIASEVRNPTFDVWTGNSDKTVRKLSIGLTLPVSGELSTLAGGLTSAGITVTLQYGDLNQTQNVVAPTSTAPYSQFQTKIQEILQAVESALGEDLQTPTGSGSSSSSSGSSGSSSTVNSYSQCITAANGDVAKMQNCAALLNGSSG
jgi:hypothetical protein